MFTRVGSFLLLTKDMVAFLCMTIGPLKQAYEDTDTIQYHTELLTKKLRKLDINLILEHKLTFDSFQ